MESKEEKTKRVLVVAQLPTQQVSVGKVGDEEYDLVTIEEALTTILEKINKIEKNVA